MQVEKVEHKIVQQELALDSYLKVLLDGIPSDDLIDQIAPPPLLLKNRADLEKLTQVTKEPDNAIVESTFSHIKESLENSFTPLSVMPEWTQDEFQALFFKLDNLVLATPLTELLRTIKLEAKLTGIPNQPSWFMGLLDTGEQAIGVLDTGQLVFGKTIGQQRDQKKQPFKRILITHDGKWGLVCDEILSIGKLQSQAVRWRTLRKKRPWLMGTVIEELTAVIDINKLVPHKTSIA